MSANEKSAAEMKKDMMELTRKKAGAEEKKPEKQESVVKQAENYVKENPKKSVAAAIAIGFVAGVAVNASANSADAQRIANNEAKSRERLEPK